MWKRAVKLILSFPLWGRLQLTRFSILQLELYMAEFQSSPKTVSLMLCFACISSEDLVKNAGSASVGLSWSPRDCISHRPSGEADAPGPQPHFPERRLGPDVKMLLFRILALSPVTLFAYFPIELNPHFNASAMSRHCYSSAYTLSDKQMGVK